MKNRRILIVDDDTQILQSLEFALKAEGWLVDSVDDPADGLICNSYRDYDLIITDIVMPHLTGDEFIEIVLSKKKSTKFIVITSFGYDPNHSLVKLNINYSPPVFLKPIVTSELIEKIKEIFQQNSSVNITYKTKEVENVI